MNPLQTGLPQENGKPRKRKAFDYRLLLGWINDNSNRPLSGKRWPITDIDEQTVKDYRALLRVARDSGYNGITLWGLYASHAWPVPLKSALLPERHRVIDRILKDADKMGIKVLYGLVANTTVLDQLARKSAGPRPNVRGESVPPARASACLG